MKRFREAAFGLGLALATGTAARAADWQPVAPARAGGAQVWWPAGAPAAAPAVPPAVPVVQPAVYRAAGPDAPAYGPRAAAGALPDVPTVPAVPVSVAPPVPSPAAPNPLPERVTLPSSDDAAPLARPRPAEPAELPPAPELCAPPAGQLFHGRPGTFGSPPLRISSDWPTFRELRAGAVHPGAAHPGAATDGAATDRREGAYARFFVRGEYLLWWLPGFATPVLGTTNADSTRNGFLGEPGTTSLLGPGPFLDSTRQGFRVRTGLWLEEEGCGLDAGFFFLSNRSRDAAFGPDQFPLITRPIFAPNPMPNGQPVGESGEAVSVPGVLRGTLAARGESRLWGIDVNLRKCLFVGCDDRAEWFVGYRHLNLRERLTITEDITVVGTGAGRGLNVTDPVGTRVFVQDDFQTRNAFHGGQVGAAYERRFGNWDVDARAAVALGTTFQTLTINGFQARQRPNMQPMFFRTGGLLAAQTNVGRFTREEFSVVPEFTLNVGYRVTPNLRVFGGYNFLLWTNVIRPGDQIDRVVDVTFVPNGPMVAVPSGMNRPRPTFTQRDLAVNGIQFGADYRW